MESKLEQESTVPDFVLDKDNPLEFFEMFFDDEVYEMLRSSTEKNAIAKGQINFRLTIEEVKNSLHDTDYTGIKVSTLIIQELLHA